MQGLQIDAAGGPGNADCLLKALHPRRPAAMPAVAPVSPEFRDLVCGTLVLGLIIAAFARQLSRSVHQREERAMSRSLSCPALVELKSSKALDACAEMMAAFEDRPGRKMRRKVPSLPTLCEVLNEGSFRSRPGSRRSSQEGVGSSPRGSPRTEETMGGSPRGSMTASPLLASDFAVATSLVVPCSSLRSRASPTSLCASAEPSPASSDCSSVELRAIGAPASAWLSESRAVRSPLLRTKRPGSVSPPQIMLPEPPNLIVLGEAGVGKTSVRACGRVKPHGRTHPCRWRTHPLPHGTAAIHLSAPLIHR